MGTVSCNRQGLLRAAVGDGRPPLLVLGLGLTLSGLFALFLAVTGEFLPHDERFLGMTAEQLCGFHGCRIVHFMIHDRASFGGAMVAIGLLYLWLTAFPLRQRQVWAWWLLLLTGSVGFASFFAYLGYGYLDTWHGIATLGLLPCYLVGLAWSRVMLVPRGGLRCLLQPATRWSWSSPAGLGRGCLLAAGAGLTIGGLTLLVIGMTCVFVPQDLEYMGLSVEELHQLNPRLVPLIAHDRAGFGGAVCCFGIGLFFCVWCGAPSRALWQVLTAAGVAGFGNAIGVHPAVGYNDAVHLAPAVIGAIVYLVGLLLTFRPMFGLDQGPRAADGPTL